VATHNIAEADEAEWLRDRIKRVKYVMLFINDRRALDILEQIVLEAEARLARIRGQNAQ
jgi:hypothetical protein